MRDTGGPAQELRDQLARRDALGERVAVPAMRAENRVVGSRVRAHADRDRFLTNVGVASPVHESALVRAGQHFLRTPDDEHAAIQLEHSLCLVGTAGG
jgi:hypothetical protein